MATDQPHPDANGAKTGTDAPASKPPEGPPSLGAQLIAAACQGDVPLVTRLLKQDGAPVNYSDSNGYTALHAACGCFEDAVVKPEVVRLLLVAGADVNATLSSPPWCTPLHWAAIVEVKPDDKRGEAVKLELLRELLRNGANVNATDRDGSTPLHWVSWMPHVSTPVVLLMHGADPNARDAQGRTALHIAAGQGAAGLPVATLLARNTNAGELRRLLEGGHVPTASPAHPVLQHFAGRINSVPFAGMCLSQRAGRLRLRPRKVQTLLLWLASREAADGPKWVEVPHRERLTKLVVVALVGVPKLHTQAFPLLTQLCCRSCCLDLPAGSAGPQLLLSEAFFRPPPPPELHRPPPAPATVESSDPASPETLRALCLPAADLPAAGYPTWDGGDLGLRCPRDVVSTALPAVALSCVELGGDGEGRPAGFQLAMLDPGRKVLFDTYFAADIAEATEELELQRLVLRLVNAQTVLIGHRGTLAPALRRLKLVHARVLDVAWLFRATHPLPAGTPIQLLAQAVDATASGTAPSTAATDCQLSLRLLDVYLAGEGPPPPRLPPGPTPSGVPGTPAPPTPLSVRCITADPDTPVPPHCEVVRVSSDEAVCQEAIRHTEGSLNEVLWVQLGASQTNAAADSGPAAKRQKVAGESLEGHAAQRKLDEAVDRLVKASPPNTGFVIYTAPELTLPQPVQGVVYFFAQNQVQLPP